MDPQLKAIATNVVKDVVMALGVWAVAHGIIPAGDETQVVNDVVGIVMVGLSQGLTWYNQRQVSPAKMIEKINNTDNGVKVVAASAPEPTVTGPLKK